MLRTIAFGRGSYGAANGSSAATTRIRGNRNLALLVRDRGHSRQPHREPSAPLPKDFQTLVGALAPFEKHPRRLARRLLDNFGSIAGIAQAQDEELRQLQKFGEAWAEKLIGARRLLLCGVLDQAVQTRFETTREPLYRYLIYSLGGLRHERLVAIFLDAEGMVICEQTMAEGEVGEVTLPLRHIVGRALSVGARAVVIAHNHPSGCVEPSEADIRNTKRLKRAMRDLGVQLLDHLIVGRGHVASMRDGGTI